MTEIAHLKRLSELKSNTGIRFLTPAAQPGNHCPLHTATRFAGEVAGLSTLLVGTPECCTYADIAAHRPEGSGTSHRSYVLDANDVVFGCRDGLIAAIAEMDKAGARAILVAVTCVPELVGEDVGAILREAKGNVGAKLAYVMLGNFKCVDASAGSWKSFEAMVSFMEPKAKRPYVINILGGSDGQSQLPSVLEKRGFCLRFIGQGASLGKYETATDAALNIVAASSTIQMAERMKKEFGTPFVDMCGLYAPEDLRGAYAEIGEILGVELQGEFDGKQAILLQEGMRERFGEKTFILTGMRGETGLPIAAYLTELGMIPLLVDLPDFTVQDKKWAERITQRGVDPPVCHMINGEADSKILAGFAPDLLLGMQARGGRGGGRPMDSGRGGRPMDGGRGDRSIADRQGGGRPMNGGRGGGRSMGDGRGGGGRPMGGNGRHGGRDGGHHEQDRQQQGDPFPRHFHHRDLLHSSYLLFFGS
ncbi:MAG: nitrogenase component 1 [Clostridiales Family XIII bacterium]|jgi:nitrogenase molybdenum-iron protein alpha/beta subunit|nr:nitrogenase component 1 [Clostridiales Family XIII bacterium]